MSLRYSSCFSFSSPNMRSVRTSEKPMIAFSGVRSSWDILARNSLLCWLATSSWRLSWMIAGHDETSDQPVLAGHRHGQDGADTGLNKVLPQSTFVGSRDGDI